MQYIIGTQCCGICTKPSVGQSPANARAQIRTQLSPLSLSLFLFLSCSHPRSDVAPLSHMSQQRVSGMPRLNQPHVVEIPGHSWVLLRELRHALPTHTKDLIEVKDRHRTLLRGVHPHTVSCPRTRSARVAVITCCCESEDTLTPTHPWKFESMVLSYKTTFNSKKICQ